MPSFTHSIVFKISVAILVLETLVLATMGHFYVTRFHHEVDSRIRTAAHFPGTLMDEHALSFDAARDLAAMSRLVGEEVIESAVIRSDGQVFYASDRGKEDFSVSDVYGEAVGRAIRPESRSSDLFSAARAGREHLISVTPIRSDGKMLGFLYLKVDTRRSETEKKNIFVLFALGSALCILLTTLAEVIIVHFLISPRIRRTVDCLEAVEGGDLAARVPKADSGDEIGVMQRSVNDMVAEVETLVGEVQEINRRLETEIAERRRSEQTARHNEQRFRDLAELLPEIIYEMDAKGRLTFVNRQGMERFGFTEADIGKGRSAIKFLVPEDRKRALENIGRLFKGELKGGREYTMRRRDGAMIPVIIFSAPILRDDKPVGLRGLIVDMSRQKNLEERLRQAAKMEAVGTLAGGVAHDFNNILQAISGYAELLLDDAHDAAGDRQHVVQIERASNRGAELVRSLLAFSRKDEPALRPLDLNREVLQTVRLLERTIPKMIRIETRLAADLRQVNADPGQLAQVVMNLGANARDAMADGGTLRIETRNMSLDEDYCSVHPEARPGPYVELRVSDTGEGIPQELLGQIYDPFFTTKDVGSGTGLGLSTVYGVIKGHGGQITCESPPGEGTTFSILLPAQVDEEPAPVGPAAVVQKVEGGNETVLIVDDEEPVVKLARTLLGRRGYDVLAALSGEEALEIYRARPGAIDLVILDLGMPGMGGEKCLEELLRLDPDARVMIASGYNVDAQAQGVLQAGARDFISKPYRLDELVRRVRKVLDG